MALTWNVEDFPHKVHEDGTDAAGVQLYSLDRVTEALVFSTMAIDMGEITEKNAQEFYERLYAWERSRGALLRQRENEGAPWTDRYITPADVLEHVGMRTNVVTESTAKFYGKLRRVLTERARESWQMAKDKAPDTVETVG